MTSRTLVVLTGLCTAFLVLAADAPGQSLADAGVPDLNRPWTGADYKRAADALASGKAELPILTDVDGRAFLKRFTSPDNLARTRDTHIPIADRLRDFTNVTGACGQILTRYAQAADKGAKVHSEIAMLLSQLLRVAQIGIVLADEFLPSIPRDAQYEARVENAKNIYTGMASIFAEVDSFIDDTSFYTPDDLSPILQTMAEVLPTVKKALPPDYLPEFKRKLESRKTLFSKPKDAANLERMLNEISC